MSVAVKAPWEGHTGYRTTVAWRYNGELAGDDGHARGGRDQEEGVGLLGGRTQPRGHGARSSSRRSGCAACTKEVAGSIAFVPTTQSWLSPMREVWDGVLGSQDVNICH